MITFTSGSQLPAADLNANFAELTRTASTLILRSAIAESGNGPLVIGMASNTTALLGQVIVPFKITVNKISIFCNLVNTAGTIDLSLYSEDGQTRLFSVTTATVSGSTIITTAVPSVVIQPGIYYLMANTNGTTDANFYSWSDQLNPFAITSPSLMMGVTSEPVMQGTLTIVAGTPPATFSPNLITPALYSTLIARLDN